MSYGSTPNTIQSANISHHVQHGGSSKKLENDECKEDDNEDDDDLEDLDEVNNADNDPILKHSRMGADEYMQYASTSMQGGRDRMEDRHVCMLDAFEQSEKDLFQSSVTSRPWYYYSENITTAAAEAPMEHDEPVPNYENGLHQATTLLTSTTLSLLDSASKLLSSFSSKERLGMEKSEESKEPPMDMRYHPNAMFLEKDASASPTSARPIQRQKMHVSLQQRIMAGMASAFRDFSNNYNLSYFGVFDGHGSDKCSKFVSRRLLPAVMVRECTRNTDWLRLLDSDRDIIDSFLALDRHFMDRHMNEFGGSAAVNVFMLRSLDTRARIGLSNSVEIICANIGDSRCVLYHDNETYDLSTDHRPDLPQEYERIIRAGGFVNHFDLPRVNGILALTRSFGDQFLKTNSNLSMESQSVIAVPDVVRMKLDFSQDCSSFSFVVLASDGVWDVMSSKEVTDFVVEKLNEQRRAYEQLGYHESQYDFDLVSITEALVDEVACSSDNISVILVLFKKY